MKKELFDISTVPSVAYGENSDSCFLFVHGLGGNKFEAERFASIANAYGHQVLSIDLPKHGNRTDETNFVPWEIDKELNAIMSYAKRRWNKILLRATSIGAYFSLLSLKAETFEKCLFVSPLLDMERMITDLMKFAGVTEERLKIEKEIKTDFGQTLSWEYLRYARNNPVKAICKDTEILCASNDEVIPYETVLKFSECNGCRLTVLDGGEHWLHMPDDVRKMEQWEASAIATNEGGKNE